MHQKRKSRLCRPRLQSGFIIARHHPSRCYLCRSRVQLNFTADRSFLVGLGPSFPREPRRLFFVVKIRCWPVGWEQKKKGFITSAFCLSVGLAPSKNSEPHHIPGYRRGWDDTKRKSAKWSEKIRTKKPGFSSQEFRSSLRLPLTNYLGWGQLRRYHRLPPPPPPPVCVRSAAMWRRAQAQSSRKLL
jgi:hypothetical protein